MTVHLVQASRRSRFLFEWNAKDCLAAADQSLDALTGQAATYSRASTKTAIDQDGKVRLVPKGRPAFQWALNSVTGLYEPGLLLEGARTNLVVQSDALTAANGWTVAAGAGVTAAYALCGTLALSRITAADVGDVYRTVTLTGNAVKAFSCVVQWDSVAGTTSHGLYDASAASWRGLVTVTWAADGTATAVANNGTLLAFQRLADVGGMPTYRIMVQTTACTAANTHRAWPSTSGGSATSVRIGGVQVEDAECPSTIISTTTTTITRSADTLSFPFLTLPRALSAYTKHTEAGSIHTGAAGAFVIGAVGVAADAFAVYRAAAGKYAAFHVSAAGNGESVAAAAPALGDTVELNATLSAAGAPTLGQSLNSAAEVVAAAGTARAQGTAWSDDTLILNVEDVYYGLTALQSLRIAAGVQTMAYMRAG